MTNAILEIEEHGIISITSLLEKDKIKIQISDTGCGISQENLPRITDPFFTTKVTGKGTGLGLSITINIIQEYNGTINFDSQVGKGTTVTISLPLYNQKA